MRQQAEYRSFSSRSLCAIAVIGVAIAAPFSAAANKDPSLFFEALLRDERACPLNRAFAGLWLGRDLPLANVRLREAFDEAMGEATSLNPEVADTQFKWQMRTWIRMYYLFGPNGGRRGMRLEPDIEHQIEELFWYYGVSKSDRARANLDYVWLIQGSENHDLMDLGNAFLGLQAIASNSAYSERKLADGGTPNEHAAVWSNYFQQYCHERIQNGLFIEVASPTYGKYLIPELVNISEFADEPALRESGTSLLHLTWADWAIEQLNGVRGGAKARCYQGDYSREGHADSWWQMGQCLLSGDEWTRTDISRHPIQGFNLCLASSTYELPAVVRKLAIDAQGRREYAYISRRPGKMKPLDVLPSVGGHPCWYSMDAEDSRLVRYTWCTPDYIMGSFRSDPAMREDFVILTDEPDRAASRYAAIQGQNQWQGIIFASGPDARIYPQCESTPDEKSPDLSKTYVQQVAVQHENVMLVQMNRANPKNKAMRVYFSPAMRDRIHVVNGWRVVEEGESFAAVKAITRDGGDAVEVVDWDAHGLLRPADPYAPVAFVVGRTTRFAGIEQFTQYLDGHDVDVNNGELIYGFSDSNGARIELGLSLETPSIPTINGTPVDLSPKRVYDSPFVNAQPESGAVRVAFADEELLIKTGVVEAAAKPRVIVTTDGEVDDRCSMIRFLLYANEWDILGLIHSSSKYHWSGDDETPANGWEPVAWLDRQLDAYAEVYERLKSHDANYPSPEYLRAHVYVGNIATEGDMRQPTPGSDRIVDVLLAPDPTPVWLQAWGGSNTIARALKTIQDEHPDEIDRVAKKARIYLISEQDNTLKTYIRPEWPGIQVVRSGGPSFGAIAYDWQKLQPKTIQTYFDQTWMTTNILEDHGPLCAMYEAKDGRFRSEGDSPAFLHVINTGLRSDEHPAYGGWGGRFAFSSNVWKSVDKEGVSPHSILRWAPAFQNDWAARADWCVKPFGESNHAPHVNITPRTDIVARPSERISLSAEASTDPDGDRLAYRWWMFSEAGSYGGAVTMEDAEKPITTFSVPNDAAAGDTLHVICSVTDSGNPPLTRYARTIISVHE